MKTPKPIAGHIDCTTCSHFDQAKPGNETLICADCPEYDRRASETVIYLRHWQPRKQPYMKEPAPATGQAPPILHVSLDPFPLHPVGEIRVIPSQNMVCYQVSRDEIEALFAHYQKRIYDPWRGCMVPEDSQRGR